ncbi:hypothetical protein HY605_00415 [Candidatus Peregrinibacteria bacterium]|nr:hypothetical protein [Candidatus Peregrinibacteria bacterium]
MAKQGQNSGSDEKEILKPAEGKKEDAKKHKNYATQVWNQIEKKAKSKSKRQGLKEKLKVEEEGFSPSVNGSEKVKDLKDVKEVDANQKASVFEEGEAPQKKKRRRKRKKKSVEEPVLEAKTEGSKPEVLKAPLPVIETPQDEELQDETPQDEVLPPVVEELKDVSEELPPVSPFEALNQEETTDNVMPPEDNFAPVNPFDSEPESMPPSPPVEPVNPFAAAPSVPVEPSYGYPAYDQSQAQQPQVQSAGNLPPQSYEHRYNDQQNPENLNTDLEPPDEGSDFSDLAPLNLDEDAQTNNQPVNPFETIPDKQPLEEKALDEKPLDEFAPAQPKEDEDIEPEDAESTGYADEQVGEDAQEETFAPTSQEAEVGEVVETRSVDEGQLGGHADLPVAEVKDLASELDDPEFKEELWDVLAQAGITKKRLFISLGVLGFIILVILIWVFAFSGDGGGSEGSASDNVEEADNAPEADNSEEETGSDTEPEVLVSGNPYEVISAFIIGLDYSANKIPFGSESPVSSFGGSAGFESALALGQSPAMRSGFIVEYSELLRKLQNIYDVDVYALVSQAVDRRAVLEQHILDMQNLINEGDQLLIRLDNELAALKSQYASLIEQKDLYETAFFEQLQAQLGEASSGSYEKYLEFSKASLLVKAEFSARASIREMLIRSLNFLKPRLQDIILNKESIITGVRYYEVPGSDIDAVNLGNL